jgi:hypothetical protein
MSEFSTFIKAVLISSICLLPACATATRGSHTVFVVHSVPEGAAVTTDLELPDSLKTQENIPTDQVVFYGCKPTPCGIKLPRRSDFNVMILKPGHQPSTHSVFKDRNDMQAKNTELAATGSAVATSAYFSANAIAWAAESGAIANALLPAPAIAMAGIIVAIPVIGAVAGVDLASGALIDLNPNPLDVELKPEVSPEETGALITAFDRSRLIKAGHPAPDE